MMISYDHFSQLDIRIGTVRSVEVMLEADRLLKLSVDIGEEAPRTIVSGIREYIENPESLIDTQIVLIANLEPRTIKGIESQGMILAASGDEHFTLLIPKEYVPEGSRVK